jgi:beta-xylosidase
MRPTVVNCYEEKLNTMNDWWKHWKHFMFNSEIAIKKKTTSGDAIQKLGIYQIIPKIEKAKYPSITSEEEKISVPLSILSLAIFDSILVHMMNTLAADSWQQLRSQICTQCNFQKNQQILNILINSYNDSNFIFLQEVAGSFFTSFQQQIAHKKGNVDDLQRYNSFLSSYHIVFSSLMDYDRDQNSFILLKKDQFHEIKEVTEGVLKILDSQYAEKGGKNPVVNGDLLAITAIDKRDNVKYLFASFHGDTNG